MHSGIVVCKQCHSPGINFYSTLFNLVQNNIKVVIIKLHNFLQCHQQPAVGNESGFYTANHMMEALRILDVENPKVPMC